jgi:hypothetical protein
LTKSSGDGVTSGLRPAAQGTRHKAGAERVAEEDAVAPDPVHEVTDRLGAAAEGVAEEDAVTPDPVHEVTDRLGAAAERLAELADEPVAEHVARYDALHGELQDALAAIDEV